MGEALPLIISAASTAFAPALSAGIASVFGVAAGTLTNVVAGALLGAATSALMGGDPLTGALFGGLGGGVGSLFGGGADAAEGAAGAAGVADDAGASMLTFSCLFHKLFITTYNLLPSTYARVWMSGSSQTALTLCPSRC